MMGSTRPQQPQQFSVFLIQVHIPIFIRITQHAKLSTADDRPGLDERAEDRVLAEREGEAVKDAANARRVVVDHLDRNIVVSRDIGVVGFVSG